MLAYMDEKQEVRFPKEQFILQTISVMASIRRGPCVSFKFENSIVNLITF